MLSVTRFRFRVPANRRGRYPQPPSSGAAGPGRIRWLAALAGVGMLIALALGSTPSVFAGTPVQITFTTFDKDYDGTTDATIDGSVPCEVTGANPGDDVHCDGSAATATFDSRNAGTVVGVTGRGFELSGADKDNYQIESATSSATISPADLDINAATDSKTYDGGTTSTATPTFDPDQIQTGDSLTDLVQEFTSKNVLGTDASSITVTDYTLDDGNGGNNYDVELHDATGTIIAASLDISAAADSRVYNGTTSSTGTPTVSGLQGTVDSVTGLAQAFDSRNVGARTLSVSAGFVVNDNNGGNNYDVDATHTAAGSISQAPLDIYAVSDSRQYNGGKSSSGVPTLGAGQLQTGDSVTGRAQEFVSKNVLGTNGSTLHVTGYTVNDGNFGNNYVVDSSHTAAGTITTAPLDIFATAQSRGYNGTALSTATPTYTVAQVQTGDTVTGLVQVFDSRNAGSRTLSVSAYSVNDSNGGNNYAVDTHTAAGSISQALLTVNAVNNDKVADGTTSAAAIPTTPGPIYTGDNITGSFSETYGSSAAGFPKTLTPAGVVNDGNSGLNYAYTYNTFANGRIRPGPVASLTFTAQPIDTKIATPIYNTCAPGGNPCAASSAPVQVTARDQYGNLAGPGAPGADNTTAAINVVIKKDDNFGATVGPNSGTATSNGVASFGSTLTIQGTFIGRTALYALTSSGSAPTTTSTFFRIVNDLAPCNAAVCKNNIGNGGNNQTQQYLYGQITRSGSYTATTLTTQFVAASQIDLRCGSNRTINVGVELRATGADVTATNTGYMLMIIPKATLKADGVLNRGTPSFNVCLGALFLGDATHSFGSQHAPWRAISGPATERQDTIAVDGDTYYRYWGAPANCGAAGLTSTDPCIVLRTKQKSDVTALVTQGVLSAGADANMHDSDLAIVIRKPSPWDGKGGVY